MNGADDGALTCPRYRAGLIAIVTGVVLPEGTESMAAWTVAKSPVPSPATVANGAGAARAGDATVAVSTAPAAPPPASSRNLRRRIETPQERPFLGTLELIIAGSQCP